jgi:peptidoglycan/xylan/chitin deacetylase (PgdA/CDA1 family)
VRSVLAAAARAAGEGVARIGLGPVLIGRRAQALRVLLYHSVGPAGSPFLGGIGTPIPTREFERHLDHLIAHYTPVALQDLIAGDLPPRAVLVTFDDGYRCLLTHAFEPLRVRGISPTVFLIGNAVGNRSLVWTNEIAWALNTHRQAALDLIQASCPELTGSSTPEVVHFLWTRLPPARLTHLLGALRGRLCHDPRALAEDAGLYMSWHEIAFLREHGWTFGNHTANHYSLPTLDPEEQQQEIAEGRAILEAHLGDVYALAYPFGDHDTATRQAALRTGHRVLMEVGGINGFPVDLTRVARIPSQGRRAPAGLFAEMEVVAPLKASLRAKFSRA